jgi:hypothetical protein
MENLMSPKVQNLLSGDHYRTLAERLERMHERDRERVIAGEIVAEDLHFIPPEMARRSIVRWTEAAFRGLRR